VNNRELSEIKIFQHSGKGIPLIMTGHKKGLQPVTTMGGVFSVLKLLKMSVTNQQGNIKKMFPFKLKNKAVCIRISNLAILNAVSSQVT
jgi:hypothetical protein